MNCVKHSRARSVAIDFSHEDERVRLSIKDDGIGFDPGELERGEQTPGLGLLSMQERGQSVGGVCRIESSPGHGTKVFVDIARLNTNAETVKETPA